MIYHVHVVCRGSRSSVPSGQAQHSAPGRSWPTGGATTEVRAQSDSSYTCTVVACEAVLGAAVCPLQIPYFVFHHMKGRHKQVAMVRRQWQLVGQMVAQSCLLVQYKQQ
jgi:hypothetical protein